MDNELFAVKPAIAARAHVDAAKYRAMVEHASRAPQVFWAEQAKRLEWVRFPTKIKDTGFTGDVSIKWFEDGVLNASACCLDRHLATRADQTAIIWEGDDPAVSRHVTYRELHDQVCRLANAMRNMGVGKRDRVTIYLPMVPEAAVAMLACARIGAIHSVVFGGFSPDSLANRIQDCASTLLITADEGRRGGRTVPLKTNADMALGSCPTIKDVIVVGVTGAAVPMRNGRDHDYAALLAASAPACEPAPMGAEDPLFILYTSGSTGKPKGALHTTGGYMVWASFTHELVFDYQPGEIYWCTADVGWVTGHTYIVYGPLANGATTLMFEGIPNYPDSSRFWQVVDKHKVNIFYTAPTAIRALMREGEDYVRKTSRQSIRLLGSVGEPINPEAWLWYFDNVGDGRCPIVDTWWQTETGGIMISPLPGVTPTKPGSCTKPLPGIVPDIVSKSGASMPANQGGYLVVRQSWPSMLRTLYGDHERFVRTYFTEVKGCYFTGDGARRDQDGYYWVMGRVDDVLNVAGHRLSTMEIESALVSHARVAEAAVVGYPHELKGEGICCFVTLKQGDGDEALKEELKAHVRKHIGALATPDAIRFTSALPKTRSGKIMRRLLRDIAAGKEQVGDTTTLEDYSILAKLRQEEE